MLQNEGVDEPIRIAQVLSGMFRETYGAEVDIVIQGATITIARGKRAAQIRVMEGCREIAGDMRFVVSLRKNQTFLMHPEPVDTAAMAGLVARAVGG